MGGLSHNFIKPVLLMMLYIRAEREADWRLHLYAVKEMLPYFFAVEHHNYTRYGTYYLRLMERLPDDILRHFMKGHHVMRHKPGIWNAVWSDMFIESTFMRYGHGAGGIIGITLKPSALKKWAFSMHICSQLKQDVIFSSFRGRRLGKEVGGIHVRVGPRPPSWKHRKINRFYFSYSNFYG